MTPTREQFKELMGFIMPRKATHVSRHFSLVGCPPSKHAIFLIHLRLFDIDSLVNQGNRDWFHPPMGQYADQVFLDCNHNAV